MARPRKNETILDTKVEFRIDKRHLDMLDKMCRRDKKTRSYIIRRAIRNEFYELGYNDDDLR